MVNCRILGCKSRSDRKDPGITFHSFPPDPMVKLKWVRATGRQNWQPNKYSTLCSLHFEASSFIFTPNRTHLLLSAMPIKLIHNAGSDEISTSTITSSTKRKGFDDENTPPVIKPYLNNTLLEEASGSKRHIIIKSSANRNHVFAPVQNMSPIQLNNSIGSINDKTQTKRKRTDDQDMQANKKLCLD